MTETDVKEYFEELQTKGEISKKLKVEEPVKFNDIKKMQEEIEMLKNAVETLTCELVNIHKHFTSFFDDKELVAGELRFETKKNDAGIINPPV